MPIGIHIVLNLPVVHNLAVGGADPIRVPPCCGTLCEVWAAAWP